MWTLKNLFGALKIQLRLKEVHLTSEHSFDSENVFVDVSSYESHFSQQNRDFIPLQEKTY